MNWTLGAQSFYHPHPNFYSLHTYSSGQFSSFNYYSDKCYIMIFYKQSMIYHYNNIINNKFKNITNTVAFFTIINIYTYNKFTAVNISICFTSADTSLDSELRCPKAGVELGISTI